MEDIPDGIIAKEKDTEMQREDLQLKPFIKDDSIQVKDLVKQTVAALGKNIKVRRFVRFTLGEN